MTRRNLLAVFTVILGAPWAGAVDNGPAQASVEYVAQPAEEVDLLFLERFALAEDRGEVLKELVPGTETYYYFTCLYLQEQGQFDEVDALLKTWTERHNLTRQNLEIRNRQALLRYDDQPADTLKYLKGLLALSFDHEPILPGVAPDLPTALDPDLISRETLLEDALNAPQNQDAIAGFTKQAYPWLLSADLSYVQLRSLLSKLEMPDYDRLPELIANDLAAPNSGGFGSLPIHTLLVREQLDALLHLQPDLLNNDAFINAYMRRLVPGNDNLDWRKDPEVMDAYLNELEGFVDRLAPAQSALKAHVAYHRFAFDQSQGVYDKGRFLRYIQVPKRTPYIDPDFLRKSIQADNLADLDRDFREGTPFPPIHSDDDLVNDYLRHFFESEDDFDSYSPYIREQHLRALFAEVKLLQGTGDMEQWFSWLNPATVDALKNRVDVAFVPENKARFDLDDAVTLDLWVKNVDRMLVKVFEIDTENYYREFNAEINTAIELDGLVANQEQVYTYSEAPLRRVRRSYSFPEITGRGVWVIEFVGNGTSSRAIVAKGSLQYLSRTGPAGQVFTVFDETGAKAKDASIWFSERRYTAKENGEITLPFSTNPSHETLLLCQGDFAQRAEFDQAAEHYALRAGFHIDTESLRAGQTAHVAVRPLLYLNESPMPVSLLKDPVLEIHSVTHDGVESRQEIEAIELKDDAATVQEFRVPENLAKLTFTLRGSINFLTLDRPMTLHNQFEIDVNGIYSTPKTQALLLSKSTEGYTIESRDSSGNPLPDRVINLGFKHKDFSKTVQTRLKTDPSGRVRLGSLTDIGALSATNSTNRAELFTEAHWKLPVATYTYPRTLQGSTDQPLHIPYVGDIPRKLTDAMSLLETRNGVFVADHSDAVTFDEGYLIIAELPAGDYVLHLKDENRQITVRLSEGERSGPYVASRHRVMEDLAPTALQIQSVESDGDTLAIQTSGANAFTRIHVVATRFLPERMLAIGMFVKPPTQAEIRSVNPGYALYTSGRQIGDEYRYILDRRFATKYPGNMLDRPSLLLNPWAIQETDATQEEAEAGMPAAMMAEEPAPAPPEPSQSPPAHRTASMGPPFSPSYDFLDGAATTFYNLEPDENGVVTLTKADLQGRTFLQIVATDPTATVSRLEALEATPWTPRDLRLANGLDPKTPVVEQKQIDTLDAGERLTVSLTGDADVQVYDSVASVLGLLTTLNKDARFQEFSFVGRWPQLSAEEKLEKFSKYESHELNFFLYHKDRAFFDATVRPYLVNKYEKTFLDHWLLEADLTAHLSVWRFDQLNLVEQLLLAKRMPEALPELARQVKDGLEMMPPDPDHFNRLFMAALHGGALANEGGAGGFGGGGGGGGFGGGGFRSRSNAFSNTLANGVAVSDDIASYEADSPIANAQRLGRKAKLSEEKEVVRQQVQLELDANSAAMESFSAITAAAQHSRDAYRRLYQSPEKTQALIETNYYQRRIEETHGDIIPVNAFWLDFAETASDQAFLSAHVAEAASSFTEALLALALLDVPFEAPEHKTTTTENAYTLEAGGAAIAFYKDTETAASASNETPVLVSQNYFREGDRFRFEGNQRFDKFVTDEFLTDTVYGVQITVTNPTSAPFQIDVLHQIPTGALPVNTGRYTKSDRMALDPYSTARLEYFFYFPHAGSFAHFPVHISQDRALLAAAEGETMQVVAEPSTIDTRSWTYLSQQAPAEELLAYLEETNLNRIDLSAIQWRMKDKAFYHSMMDLLERRRVVSPALWSYAFHHNDADVIRTYLEFEPNFLLQTGPYVESPLLRIEPVERKFYQHIEYAPLINPRAHHPDGKWMITNTELEIQYRAFLNVLAHRSALAQGDLLALCYYFLLQDRVPETLDYFGQIDVAQLPTRVQYDYLLAYLKFYEEAPAEAATIAANYVDYPVSTWRDRFAAVAAQASEIAGSSMTASEGLSSQDSLAAEEPQLDLELKDDAIVLHYQNLAECTMSFYPIDLEMLFTRSPFALAGTNVIAGVKPLSTQTVVLSANQSQMTVPLPEDYASSHVVVKVDAAGINRSDIRYASQLVAQLVERYGQVQVNAKSDGKALSRVYVKVFARLNTGQTLFYRDGYTDLRGRFDYASSSTLDLDTVAEFAVLVLSEDHGAKVLMAAPPAR